MAQILTVNDVLEGHVILDAAVSYTHLRAHETVLDIVCRLLLEKKTHNIPSRSYSVLYRIQMSYDNTSLGNDH